MTLITFSIHCNHATTIAGDAIQIKVAFVDIDMWIKGLVMNDWHWSNWIWNQTVILTPFKSKTIECIFDTWKLPEESTHSRKNRTIIR